MSVFRVYPQLFSQPKIPHQVKLGYWESGRVLQRAFRSVFHLLITWTSFYWEGKNARAVLQFVWWCLHYQQSPVILYQFFTKRGGVYTGFLNVDEPTKNCLMNPFPLPTGKAARLWNLFEASYLDERVCCIVWKHRCDVWDKWVNFDINFYAHDPAGYLFV